MNSFMQALSNLIHGLKGYGIGSGILIIAFVSNWPKVIPKTKQDWWDWMRATFETALPIKQRSQENKP